MHSAFILPRPCSALTLPRRSLVHLQGPQGAAGAGEGEGEQALTVGGRGGGEGVWVHHMHACTHARMNKGSSSSRGWLAVPLTPGPLASAAKSPVSGRARRKRSHRIK